MSPVFDPLVALRHELRGTSETASVADSIYRRARAASVALGLAAGVGSLDQQIGEGSQRESA